jgi:FkbM family methyltransferase
MKSRNKNYNLEWLLDQAGNESSRQWLMKIDEWRRHVFEKNDFIGGDGMFSIQLGKHTLWFRPSSAYSSIEIYTEIFKNNNHFLHPEFTGENANVVVDIGGNQGFYALKISTQNPQCKVISCEPNPYVFEIMNKNVQANNLFNVLVNNAAVASSKGFLELEIIKEVDGVGGKKIERASRPWLKESFIENITVESTTLEQLLKEHHISKVDILKIDVEGMEMEILSSCNDILPDISKIVVECHSEKLRRDIVGLLANNGLRLVYEEEVSPGQLYKDLYFINKNH